MKTKFQGCKSPSIILTGKTVLVILLTFAFTAFTQKSNAQADEKLSSLLTEYYNIKNALVAGNVSAASTAATGFLKAANGIDSKTIAEDKLTALQKDAGAVEQMKDIKHQREHFASLSANMLTIAKKVKLSAQPVYALYCPMKKSYWLSNEKTVKNPYFGSAMLSCGSVAETLNQ